MPALRGERPAYNLIGHHHFETPLTPEAFNRLADHLSDDFSADADMNLLLGFAEFAFHRHHDIALVGHRCSSVRRILPLTEHASLAHALISASGATGRLYIDIFSGLFLFFGLVAARFTTPVEMSVTVFNFLHWRLHLHSIPHPIHFAGAALLALGKSARTYCNLISARRVPIFAGSAGVLFLWPDLL
jgi:hypothetical protein